MRTSEPRPPTELLDGGSPRAAPFPHFVAERALAPAVADAAYAWLDGYAPWRRHATSFFDQFECNVLDMQLPPLLEDGLVSPATLVGLRRRVEALFGVALADVYAVVAHRLVPGQGIGVHTDRPLSGTETHRVVVHVGPGSRDRSGGNLMFFASEDPRDLACAFRSVHNSAVGFELTPRSHHAVAELEAGVRYTLVYSFWHADCGDAIEAPGVRLEQLDLRRCTRLQVRRAPHAIAGDPLDRAIRALVQAGAGHTPRPESALLPDLVHVYELLRDWECSDAVCLAGLYDGVYGSVASPISLFSTSERERVRDVIGKQAERLVHAGCVADEDTLRRALSADDPGLIADRRRRGRLGLDREDMVALATATLARRRALASRYEWTDEVWADELRLFGLAKPYLGSRARRALARVYERARRRT